MSTCGWRWARSESAVLLTPAARVNLHATLRQNRIAVRSATMGPSTSGSMRIAGSYTVADWEALKAKLSAAPPSAEWETAYHQFYRTRINTRYLHPMASIAAFDNEEGDGFAMATLFCPLAEFLEAC